MIEDDILDGDCILVRRDAEVRDGEIVVAVHLTADAPLGAATVKRHQKLPGSVILHPANAALSPLEIPAAQWAREWEIHGVVIGVYRPYPKLPWHTRDQHRQRYHTGAQDQR
jgi:repressor LexA